MGVVIKQGTKVVVPKVNGTRIVLDRATVARIEANRPLHPQQESTGHAPQPTTEPAKRG